MSTETTSALQASVPQDAVTIAVSSSALFDTEGRNEDDLLLPGPAFPFVKALMTVNARLRELYPDSEELFDIVLMTNNHAQVGARLINSINHYGFTINAFCGTDEQGPIKHLRDYGAKLFLSEDPRNVREAIEEGFAAATMFTCDNETKEGDTQLRVAFDGDCVLFSGESENIMSTKGLEAFLENERQHQNQPLGEGPLKCFLDALVRLQQKFNPINCPIRTYLVTARGGGRDGFRVLNTLKSWDKEIDKAVFLGGPEKTQYLQVICPHIFFDDKMKTIRAAQSAGIIAAHVPYGISNNQQENN